MSNPWDRIALECFYKSNRLVFDINLIVTPVEVERAMLSNKCSGAARQYYLHTFGRMFKSTVDDGSQQLGLQQEVPEARTVDGHVCSLDVLLHCPVTGAVHYGLVVIFLLFVVQDLVVSILFGHGSWVRWKHVPKQKHVCQARRSRLGF